MRLFPVEAAEIGSVWSERGKHSQWRQVNGQNVRRTPKAFFDELNAEFDFTIDVAALPDNALCERFWTPEDDGLAQDWTGERCWMNPPYSWIPAWTEKAATSKALTVGLLPARTGNGWFHDHVLAAGAEVRFIRGRLQFMPKKNAPFDSMVAIWRNA